MGVGEDEAEGIRRTSHYGSSNDVDDKTSAAFERTRSNEGRPKQQQQQAPTSAFAKDSGTFSGEYTHALPKRQGDQSRPGEKTERAKGKSETQTSSS